jgi:hypothetical protein
VKLTIIAIAGVFLAVEAFLRGFDLGRSVSRCTHDEPFRGD